MIAGQRRVREEVLTIDYKDVLEQAVANERDRILREVRKAVDEIKVTVPRERSYGSDERKARDYREDLRRRLEAPL